MLIRGALKILGVDENHPKKSGKRETAVVVAVITLGLLLFSWPSFGEDARKDLLFWMLTFSGALLAGAFGFDAWMKQSYAPPEPPAPPPPVDDDIFDDEPVPPEGYAR